jgi:hypothetical protein
MKFPRRRVMLRAPRIRPLPVILPFLALLASSCVVASAEKGRERSRDPERASTRRAFQKGVAFTGYSRYAYAGEGPRAALRDVAAVNAEWVSLLVTAYQETVDATAIDIAGEGTPTDASIHDIIAYAHGLGLKVLLKPHVDILLGNRWRGEIGPGFTEADWAVWFASYRSFILHYAALAAEAGADLFSVGCELDATVHRAADWRAVIAAVREVYPGRLIYADDQAESAPDAVTWWDALDLIGMDSYPTLSTAVRPSVSSLCRGWEGYLERLRVLAERWGKPLVITEIGYRSVEGGALNPWDWQKRGPVDLVTQRKAYEAALRMVAGRTWLAGMYWWQWMPDPDDGGPEDTGYSPHGKPAERVLAFGYRKPL